MEKITSRKNAVITNLKLLQTSSCDRNEQGIYVCDGYKNLGEAVSYGAQIQTVLWKDTPGTLPENCSAKQYVCPADLFDYVSTMKNSPGPIFTVKMPVYPEDEVYTSLIVLENVQDPGNVGTIIRTANAFRTDAVVLVDACADLYNPKTVRSTMGAIYRQKVLHTDIEGLKKLKERCGLKLYGAALADDAKDMRQISLSRTAVAIGSEGHGLSRELLDICDEKIIIPMNPDSESLNAGVAASVIMWEMSRELL